MRTRNFVLWIYVWFCSCLIEGTKSACPPHGYYNITSFGDNCSYQCHCVNDEQCDATSGECRNGCVRGWMGPGCQYRNISPKNAGSQNRPGTGVRSDYAWFAVDGNLSTCCRTGTDNNQADNRRHYWRIQFSRDFYIVGLKLYIIQADKELFRGFRVEAGESSTSFPTLCYEHPDSPGEEVMEVMCTSPVVTRHLRVKFRDQNVRMSLCEVEIYGGRQVSFKGATEQSSTYVEPNKGAMNSSKAVDGSPMIDGEPDGNAFKTCSAAVNKTSWWRLQLHSTLRIEEIYVYSRVGNLGQTAGFTLNISQPGGTSPWIHNDTKLNNVSYYHPREVAVIHPVDGQQVEISLANVLALCEVVVFADCLPGRCGWDCNDVCHCINVTTGKYRMAGVCPYGCEGRWTGPNNRCDHKCTETQWGPYCNNTCGQCHGNKPCDVGNGHCPDGCIVSWKPPLCAERCDDGTYGKNCRFTCGNCTGNVACDKETGSCNQGCEPGLQRPFCNQTCTSGSFGQNCSFKCGNCTGGVTCHHVTGACPGGCSVLGYKPPNCITKCDDGTYGQNCSSTCGNCTGYRPCDKVTGSCDQGCEPGLQPPYCNQTCETNTFGPNCSSNCGKCAGVGTCHHVTGHCPTGCAKVGYQPPLCNGSCDAGTFGENCTNNCSYCDVNTTCNSETGVCDAGCIAGYQTDWCDETCDPGHYGMNCSLTCENCLEINSSTCDLVTGYCQHGCKDGYHGSECVETCNKGTYGRNCSSTCGNCTDGQSCDPQTGLCEEGCSDGYLGETCHQECHPGRYGQNCTFECGNCDSSNCSHADGTCPFGCQSDYEGTLCQKLKQISDKPPFSVGTVVGGVVGGLVVVATVGVALFIYKRRQSKGRDREHEEKLEVIKSEIVSDRPSDSSNSVNLSPVVTPGSNNIGSHDDQNDHATEYYNAAPSKGRISVVDLPNFCTEMKSNPAKLFVEFAGLKIGLLYSTNAAEKPNNRAKNRYKEMYTYDKNRVHLPTVEGQVDSDYINATYITGYANTPRAYIGCQGAMDVTVSDMWRMIWSENIKTIVMLTACYERGRLKCVQYWPEDKSEVYGEITVEIESEETYAEFIIRKLRCKKKGVSTARVVYHYHHLAWPDRDVPDTELSLVQFWRTVKCAEHSQVKPWVVHCSAGVGRTGTFIALDYLFDQGKAEGEVDVNKCVHELREQRTLMVQTRDQYVYLHMALVEALSPIGNVCKIDNFQGYLKSLQNSNKSKLRKQFQRLLAELSLDSNEEENLYGNIDTRKSDIEDIYSGSKVAENINKSRNFQIVPPDVFRPRIQFDPNVTGSDYINAVYISTFKTKDQMIMTQIPLEHTVVDFLRLLWELNLTIVVLMESDVEKSDVYWPTDEDRVTHGMFTLSLIEERRMTHYTCLSLQLSKREETREVTILQFTSWPSNRAVPEERLSLTSLIAEVETLKRESGNEAPVVVQCLDGATRSGLFTVMWGILERMKMDRDVAVTETIRQMRYRRRQIIPSYEQFQFCHEAVSDYIENNQVYANSL